jgi:hypothetical protein
MLAVENYKRVKIVFPEINVQLKAITQFHPASLRSYIMFRFCPACQRVRWNPYTSLPLFVEALQFWERNCITRPADGSRADLEGPTASTRTLRRKERLQQETEGEVRIRRRRRRRRRRTKRI